MGFDVVRQQAYRDFRVSMIERSRKFLLFISLLIVIGAAAVIYSFVFSADDLALKMFIFVDVFAIFLGVIYWYLQVKPINIVDEYVVGRGWGDQLKDKIDSVKEIEEAISICEEIEGQTPELARFISSRLDVFPDSREFCVGGVRYRGFDEQILKDQTRLRLFKMSLGLLRDRLLEEQRIEDEKGKTLGVEGAERDKSVERINDLISLATTRLRTEIELLSKRANIYIVFGSAMTLAAGVVLYLTVQDVLGLYSAGDLAMRAEVTAVDMLSMATRFSVVIFIEVFAFYYLRLYKGLGEDIRFYQNEITNIEMKILSMFVAESEDSKNSLVCELAKTERNFIISNKQTTIDLERRKRDFDVIKSSADSVVKIIKSAKS